MNTPPTLYDWLGGMPACAGWSADMRANTGPSNGSSPRSSVVAGSSCSWRVGTSSACPTIRSSDPRSSPTWNGGTRLAVINSQPGADVTEEQPMPRWGWGEVGGPYTPPGKTD